MSAALTKDGIVDKMSEKAGFPAKEGKEILELILEEIKSTLESGSKVKINGFGVWSVKEKKSRPGRNPHTGEPIEISARRVVTFNSSNKLRDIVTASWKQGE